jgi:separase
MSDLISFKNLSHDRPLHSLIISFQSNALRLIAAEKRAATVHKVLTSLQLTNPSSPANLITAAVDSQTMTRDKAAMQLQLLSNTIMSMCSATQKPNDNNASKESLKPITSLTLQLLSLEIRCMSWKLSGHVCDDVKEMWEPLARYLAAFVNHFKGIEKAEFAATYKTIVRLQAAVANSVEKQSFGSPDSNHPRTTCSRSRMFRGGINPFHRGPQSSGGRKVAFISHCTMQTCGTSLAGFEKLDQNASTERVHVSL